MKLLNNVENSVLFPNPKSRSAGFLVVVHVVKKHLRDLRLSPNLQVVSNVILSRVGAILLVSCTLQTRARSGAYARRHSAKFFYLVLNLLLK